MASRAGLPGAALRFTHLFLWACFYRPVFKGLFLPARF